MRGGVYFSSTANLLEGSGSFIVKSIFTDTRYFKNRADTESSDILGELQWKWLEEELNDETADIIFFVSSIQLLPTQKIVEESWSEYPYSRDRVLRLINKSPCANVIILSGDVHMAEVSQVCKIIAALHSRTTNLHLLKRRSVT